MLRTAILLSALLCSHLPAQTQENAAKNWHQWRGPNANGKAFYADPPISWNDKTNVKWAIDVPGKSSATPIVWGERVFIVTAVPTDRDGKPDESAHVDPKFDRKTEPPTKIHEFYVYCLDRNTGKERWKHKTAERVPHEGHHPTHSYAAGSPTTDGKRLYVSFGSFGTYCYDLDGKPLWSRDLGRIISRLGWGEAVTPVIHGDSLLINWDQEVDSKLICLDPATGKTKWETPRDEKTSWTTPLVVEHKGVTQIIMNGTTRVRSYDLATGKQLWACPGMTVNAIPSAVADKDNAYIVSGYRGAAGVAVSLDARGEVSPEAGLLWKHAKGTPYVPSPLLSNGRLWFTSGNTNLLTILDTKTGKPIIDQERLPARSFYASPVSAAGRVYFVDQEGTTLVYKDAAKLELLETNKLNEPIDASPAIAGNQIFLRSHGKVYCIERK